LQLGKKCIIVMPMARLNSCEVYGTMNKSLRWIDSFSSLLFKPLSNQSFKLWNFKNLVLSISF
jgi:hypothetical protein